MLQPINTARLVLRPLGAADADLVQAYRQDPEVSRYQNWPFTSTAAVRAFLTRQSDRGLLELDDWFQIGITLMDSGEVAGDIGVVARDKQRMQVELGITLARPFQHRGIASEALSAVRDFLFGHHHIHRLCCSVDPRNLACLRLLERTGFRHEAHMIESIWINGEWVDDVIFAVLEREWKARRPNPEGHGSGLD